MKHYLLLFPVLQQPVSPRDCEFTPVSHDSVSNTQSASLAVDEHGTRIATQDIAAETTTETPSLQGCHSTPHVASSQPRAAPGVNRRKPIGTRRHSRSSETIIESQPPPQIEPHSVTAALAVDHSKELIVPIPTNDIKDVNATLAPPIGTALLKTIGGP